MPGEAPLGMAEVDGVGHSLDLPLTDHDHQHTGQIIGTLRRGLGVAMRNGTGPEIFMEALREMTL